MSDVIFDDMFMVKNIDPDGKKFDRCSRLFCDSESFSMELILDVNTQIYPINLNDKFRLMITTSVRDDGMPDEGEYDPQANYSRVAQFEYVMFGRVYRIEGDDSGSDGSRIAAYASFGGLLMRLKGEAFSIVLYCFLFVVVLPLYENCYQCYAFTVACMASSVTDVSATKEIQSYFELCSSGAAEVARLERLSSAMKRGEITEEVLETCPELASAFKLQEKLKYRKIILERSLAEQLAYNKANKCPPPKSAKHHSGEESSSRSDAPVAKKEKGANSALPKSKKHNYVIVKDYGLSIYGQHLRCLDRNHKSEIR
ncbi:hypothetical protein GCK32_012420 [Trichostrongylus colubriformis]|uniref:DNA-directed RNA polymerases I, II, and III subunit RPABC3 n=1 Tax=Trichostrongylus colubriformis TaxID=6319 RepID=A0AAN8FUC3_TRICO